MNAPLRSITRRNIAKGAAWGTPAVLLASAAPSASASTPVPTGCQTLLWTNTALSGVQGYSGVRTGTLTFGGTTVQVTVRQTRNSGGPGYDKNAGTAPSPSYGDFSATPAGAQGAWGTAGKTQNQADHYVVYGTSSVLTLNQHSGNPKALASETLTFSFTANGKTVTPKSITTTVFDITSQLTGAFAAAYYTDRIDISNATLAVTSTSGDPGAASYVTTATSIQSTATNISTTTGNAATLMMTPTAGAASVGFTYSNADTRSADLTTNSNFHYIGLGDLTVCF